MRLSQELASMWLYHMDTDNQVVLTSHAGLALPGKTFDGVLIAFTTYGRRPDDFLRLGFFVDDYYMEVEPLSGPAVKAPWYAPNSGLLIAGRVDRDPRLAPSLVPYVVPRKRAKELRSILAEWDLVDGPDLSMPVQPTLNLTLPRAVPAFMGALLMNHPHGPGQLVEYPDGAWKFQPEAGAPIEIARPTETFAGYRVGEDGGWEIRLGEGGLWWLAIQSADLPNFQLRSAVLPKLQSLG